MRDLITGKLVKAGHHREAHRKARSEITGTTLRDIKAFKLSFFDNGEPKTWRGKETATKREFGLDIHAWTSEHAKVRNDRAANWRATVPLWTHQFAATHTKELLKKKQICQETFDTLNSAIVQAGDELLYGICFQSRSRLGLD